MTDSNRIFVLSLAGGVGPGEACPRTTFGNRSRDEVLALRDQAKTSLDACIAASDADLASLLHDALQTPIAAYEVLKAKAGRLDFLDLLIKARDLIRDSAAVRGELQRRISHFFVDEFQDTDPLQAEILLLLAADDAGETDWRAVRPVPGKLFLVGDPKQSIYRFRRADVALYEEVEGAPASRGGRRCCTSQQASALRPRSSLSSISHSPRRWRRRREGSQAGYVRLEPSRPEIIGRPTLIALPVPRPYGDFGKVVNWRINESFPEAVGAFISWLVNESGWTVEEEGEAVPIRPRHVAILFRQFRNFGADITRPYVRAIESRRIPHVLVGGRSFHDREEIIALRNALTAIEWPDDELKVFATLRGPFFAIGDEALLVFRQQVGDNGDVKPRRLNPMRTSDRATLNPSAIEVADALEVLKLLHFGRNRRPIAETISALLETLRAHAGIALWPNGEQALANCQRLIDMARHFERGASSFRAFVEKLEADAERGEADEAPIVEEGVEGVRVMTVHKAKGLEFPVVVLADPTCRAARDTPSRHVDPSRRLWVEPLCGSAPIKLLEAADEELRRDQAEAVRVAYVAATRARDLFVAPVCGDELIEGWLSVLSPVLYPPETRVATLIGQMAAPPLVKTVCSTAGRRARPLLEDQSVLVCIGRCGMDRTLSGGTRPHLRWKWRSMPRFGISASWRSVQTTVPLLKASKITPRGRRGGQILFSRASQPSISVQTVTALARSEGSQELGARSSVQVERIERGDFERPSGRRFGALVHAILASVDLDADADAIQASAAVNGRLVGASEEEIVAAFGTVRATLAHPILRRAAASASKGEIRRETPVLLVLDGGLVEGVVDLAFLEDRAAFSGWTVVDFKTDREFATSSDHYTAQVTAYSAAIEAATGLPSRRDPADYLTGRGFGACAPLGSHRKCGAQADRSAPEPVTRADGAGEMARSQEAPRIPAPGL